LAVLRFDNELELRGLLDRQIGGVGGYEAADGCKLPGRAHRGQLVLRGKIDDALARVEKHCVRQHEERDLWS
jgi:hypothetical protein